MHIWYWVFFMKLIIKLKVKVNLPKKLENEFNIHMKDLENYEKNSN